MTASTHATPRDGARRRRRAAAVALGLLTLLFAASCRSSGSSGGTSKLTVLAASSLTGTFDQLASTFEKQHPDVNVVISYGSSTTLAEQIVSGAPADVIATADDTSMGIVAKKHLLASQPVRFASNTMIIATPPNNPAHVRSLADLAHADFVMCDPSAPCGAAAQQVLANANVTAQPKSLEVDAKSVLSKITLGEADAGLVYVTDARAAGNDVHSIAIPKALNRVNYYYAAPVKGSSAAQVADQWVSLVQSSPGQLVFRAAGFGKP